MVEKITDLTEEQLAKLPEYKDKWLSLGLSTEPMDRARAGAAIDQVYACAGLAPPKIKIWLRSPYEGVIGAWWVKQILKTLKGKVLDQVKAKLAAEAGAAAGDQIGDRVWSDALAQVKAENKAIIRMRVEAKVKEQISDPLKDQVKDRVWSNVWNEVKDRVNPFFGDPVWAEVWAQVWPQIWAQLWAQNAQLGDQVGERVKAEVTSQVRDQIKGQIEHLLSTESYCAGLHDANLLAPYDFFGKELGADVSNLSGLMAAAEHCGWFWPFGGVAVITEKPVELCRDGKNRLHNEKDLAIRYSDGWGVALWYGTRVEKWVITSPELITLDKILEEKNPGARKAMRERFGTQDFFLAMVREGTAKRVSRRKDPSGMPMSLFRYDEKEAPVFFVHAYNSVEEADGTKREFVFTCKNVCDDAWDSLVATYPDLAKELKDNPRKFEILKASVR